MEKRITYSILVLGVFTLVFGFWQTKANLTASSVGSTVNKNSATENLNQVAAISDEQLKKQDTDNDGLTDYEELRVYSTSPYLADSDSDGFNDKQEILSGHNPNCPEGQTCIPQVSNGEATAATGSASQSNVSLPSASDPQAIRQFLVQNGVSQDQVDALSDTEILAIYQQMASAIATGQVPSNLGEVDNNTSTVPVANTNSGLNINSVSQLQSLTGSQIRALLIEKGASADLLSKYTDEQLKQVFIQKLTEQQTNTNTVK